LIAASLYTRWGAFHFIILRTIFIVFLQCQGAAVENGGEAILELNMHAITRGA
jgi:hypothetical protein